MKKLCSKLLAVILAVVLVITTAYPAFAKSFSTNSLLTTDVGPNNWMSAIKDDASLADITMPGTHDSCTKYVDGIAGAWATTQNTTITEQLNMGVRYLDLRLMRDTGVNYNVRLVHGSINCYNASGGYLTLYEVFEDIYSFLNQNPTESVVVSVKMDAGDNINLLAQDINNLIDLRSNYWYTSGNTPQLGNVRGKCVLAYRISELGRGLNLNWGDQGSDGGAVDFGHMKVQDRYKMGSDTKWSNAVKPMLDEKKPNGVWYINFMSTTGGGIEGVQPNANRINSSFRTYEMMNNKCYGIICLDYAFEDIVTKIYKANDLVAKDQPNKDSGQYYYRLNMNTYDDVPSYWQGVSCRLYYRENNGTGQERSVLLFDQTDKYNGYAFVCAVTNNDFTGYVNGFPTRVEFSYNWTNSDGVGVDFRLYVGKGPKDTLTLAGYNTVAVNGPVNTTTSFSTNESTYPVIQSVAFADESDLNVSVPGVDSTNVHQYTMQFNMYDQYGVKWLENSASLEADVNYPGISFSGNRLLIDRYANNAKQETTFNIYATYNNGTTVLRSNPKRITLYTNRVHYSFVNYDGTVLQSGSEYAGTTPQYTGATPYRAPDESGHYTFTSWTPSTALSVDNYTYTAFFTKNNHIVARTTVQVEPTCTTEGISTNYCTCGYSWTTSTPALGHNFITVHKDPTCTEDGYTKEICRIDGYVKSNTVLPATGHDTANALRGEYVEADEGGNGYIPFYCPVCSEEIVSMRRYDSVDWNSYYDALGVVEGIKADPDYHTYDNAYILQFESAVNSAKQVENDETGLQVNINRAVDEINTAISEFSQNVGVNYYTIAFVNDSGISRKLTYKEGTPASEIAVPANTPTVTTQTDHKIFRWGTISDVTCNKTYVESNVTRPHTFNTFIAPDIVHTANCNEDASIEHRCICGYTYTEITGKGTIHSWGEWTSNGDGTHTRHCQNDSSHTETESCVINLETHSCVICDYAIDTSVYFASLASAQEEYANVNKYTQDGLDELKSVMDKAESDFALADTQVKVDAIVIELNSAISSLSSHIRHFDIQFTYVIDDVIVVSVSSDSIPYETELTLSIPDTAPAGSVVEKWTVYNTDTGKVKKFAGSVNSVDYIARDNVEIVAYISTFDSQCATHYKVTLTDISNRVTQIVYLPDGEYTVTQNENGITLSKDNKEYVLTPKVPLFYAVSGYTLNSQQMGDTLNISSDVVINTSYTAL